MEFVIGQKKIVVKKVFPMLEGKNNLMQLFTAIATQIRYSHRSGALYIIKMSEVLCLWLPSCLPRNSRNMNGVIRHVE